MSNAVLGLTNFLFTMMPFINIQPDWSAPGLKGVQTVASWVLAIGLTLAFIGLAGCVILLSFKGFGNQSAQQLGASGIVWCAIAVVVLGSLSAIFNMIMGIDLGL